MNETAIIAGVKAGVFTAIFSYLLADTVMVIVILASLFGAFLGWWRAVVHLEEETTFLRGFSELMMMLAMGVCFGVITAELGQILIPLDYGWIAVGWIVGMHPYQIRDAIIPILKKLLNGSVEIILKMFTK